MNSDKYDRVPQLIQNIYSIVNELEEMFPESKFTPDGHMVGSIGEVLAAYHYDLQLLPNSTKTHDAITEDSKMVQIKATQGRYIGIRSEPEHLIVTKLLPNGLTEEIYNGPGDVVWKNSGKMQKNGQRNISVSKLKRLSNQIEPKNKLKKIK